MDEKTKQCLKEIEEIGPLNLHKDPDYMLNLLTAKVLHMLTTMIEEENISYAKLAKRLGTSRQYLCLLFNEKRKLSLRFLIKIAIALDCKIEIKLEKE